MTRNQHVLSSASLVIVLLLAPARADDAPPLVRGEHFYNAIGTGTLTLEATATPVQLSPGQDITFTLAVRNVANPSRVQRPPLRDLPAFRSRFAIVPVDGPEPTDTSVAFAWKLRPLAADVSEIPSLRFDYFHPTAVEGKQVRTKYTPAIPLIVTPPATDTRPAINIPDRFRQPVEGPLHGATRPGYFSWLALAVCTIVAPTTWIVIWRRRHPEGPHRVRMRRSRIARDVLARLPQEPALAIRDYLVERFQLPAVGTVPQDVEAALMMASAPVEVVRAAGAFFRQCDGVRFGGGEGPTVAPLSVSGREVIALCEDAGTHGISPRFALMALAIFASGADHPAVRSRELFRAGDTPRAILTLRTALALAPTDFTLQQDLLAARETILYPEGTRPSPLSGLRHRLSAWDAYAGTALFALLAALGIALRFTTRPTVATPLVIVGTLGALAGIGVSFRLAALEQRQPPFAVLAAETRLRAGNGDSYPPRLAAPLPAGAEVTVLFPRGRWLQVELPDGAVGWLPQRCVLTNADYSER